MKWPVDEHWSIYTSYHTLIGDYCNFARPNVNLGLGGIFVGHGGGPQ